MNSDENDLELLERIDSGLYGVVWKARQRSLDRTVAVKVVHPAMMHAFNALEHARALARAGPHPSMVSVYFVAQILHPETNARVQVVAMEWLEGQTLAQLLTGPALDAAYARDIATAILAGVEFIHSKGLTHNDLHAGNVVVTSTGAKIIDIDYSAERSLALQTSAGKAERVQVDIDAAGFLIARLIQQTTLGVSFAATLADAARRARSISDLRAIVQDLGTSAPQSALLVKREDESADTRVALTALDRRVDATRDELLRQASRCTGITSRAEMRSWMSATEQMLQSLLTFEARRGFVAGYPHGDFEMDDRDRALVATSAASLRSIALNLAPHDLERHATRSRAVALLLADAEKLRANLTHEDFERWLAKCDRSLSSDDSVFVRTHRGQLQLEHNDPLTLTRNYLDWKIDALGELLYR